MKPRPLLRGLLTESVKWDFAASASLANLCYFRVWSRLLLADTPQAYYLRVTSLDYAAAFLNVTVLAIAFFAGGRIARRGGAAVRFAALVAFVVALAIIANHVRVALNIGVGDLSRWLKEPRWPAVVITAIVATIFAILLRAGSRRCLRAAVRLLAFASVCVFFTFGRALVCLWRIDPMTTMVGEASGTVSTPALGPRTIILLFDGLDRRVLFDERPDSFDAPAFDHFRAQSIEVSRAREFGPETLVAVPALISGIEVSSARPLGPAKLQLMTRTSPGALVEWSELPSLFRAVHALGMPTSVVGWYHPYCRLFPDVLSDCSWVPHDSFRAESIAQAMAAQATTLAPGVGPRIAHLRAFNAVMTDAKRAVASTTGGVLFVHLPVPHFPWIYSRKRGSPTVWNLAPNGYFENLALADDALAELIQTMENAQTWDESNVLVIADHGWRSSPKRDRRIPFLLKLAGERRSIQYDGEFDVRRTTALVTAIESGQVNSAENAIDWMRESP